MIVVLHSAISFSNFAPWWSVKEANDISIFFDVILLILDVFPMPILFFIAGYFAIPSYRKNGQRIFLKRKFRRLGLPLLFMVPIISPFSAYVHHYTLHGYSYYLDFGEYWLNYMKSGLDFRIRILTSVDQFSQSHLWFMSLLLFFFIIFAVLAHTVRHKTASSCDKHKMTSSTSSMLLLLTGIGFLTLLSTFISDSIFANPSNPNPWVSIANILQFQPGRVVSYTLYFGLGVYAFQKKWFVAGELPGRLSLWAVLSILLTFCYLVTAKQLISDPSLEIYLVFLFVRSFFCVFSLVMFTMWAHLHWNQTSRLDALLASNSYYIYVVHLLIVIILQLVFSFWSDGSVLLKFAMIAVTSIFLSCAIGQYALRLYPRLSVLGIYAVLIFAIMSHSPT